MLALDIKRKGPHRFQPLVLRGAPPACVECAGGASMKHGHACAGHDEDARAANSDGDAYPLLGAA